MSESATGKEAAGPAPGLAGLANLAGPAKPSRYLVTGGLGYVGAWITTLLARQGHRVFVLTRRNQAPDLGVAYQLLSLDLAGEEPEAIADLLPDALDGVVHAASLNEAFLPGYPRRSLLTNALGTRNLLEALGRKYGDAPEASPLFLYLSTIHVYGHVYGHGNGAQGGEVDEGHPPAPRNDYALTHFFGEEYCRLFQRVHQTPAMILRLSNGYGVPRLAGSDKGNLLLNDLCRMAATEHQITLRAHPGTERDFIWLGDVAAIAAMLLQRRDLSGRLFNLSSGRNHSIGGIAGLVARIASTRLGKEIPVNFSGPGDPGPAVSGPDPVLYSNAALLQAIEYTFRDRLEETVHGLLEQPLFNG